MRDIALIIHFIGLAMGMGTAFSFMFVGMAAARMPAEKGIRFSLNASVLSRMGHIGYSLLILSGLYLIIPYWSGLGDNALLLAKLILVVVLGALIGIIGANMRRAHQSEPEKHLKKAGRFGPLALLTGISILVISVLLFH